MKKSLRVRLAVTMMLIVLMLSACTIIAGNLFLTRYYISSKEKALESTFETINSGYVKALLEGDSDTEESSQTGSGKENSDSAAEIDESTLSGTLSDSFAEEIDKISQNKNLAIIIYRDIGVSLYNFMPGSFTKLLLYTSLEKDQDTNAESSHIYNDFAKNAEDNVQDPSRGQYVIRQMNIPRLGGEYIYLYGTLNNGDHIMIRASVEGIRESVTWSNHFIAILSVIIAVVGFLIVYFLSGRFAKPILDLTDIATRMSNLDFTAKYEGKSEDEIGQLGKSMNTLSSTLEKTLGELKDANIELKADIKKKEEIDEMRKEFISNISHEFKTPIALISGYAEGLMDNVNEDEESRNFYCEVIMDEAKKMDNMVKQIISLNQLEFGYSKVNMEHFDIVELIRGIVQRSSILIEQKEAQIIFMNTEPVYVWSDAYMTDEVFTNYFTNALNHLEGERNVVIDLEQKKKTVRVSVFNTGKHIPEDSIGRIWDKFYKVDKARTREYGGSGVGLSIVKAIMKLLGQQYGAENVEGGVRFWFELDTANDDEMDEAAGAKRLTDTGADSGGDADDSNH